MDAPASGRSAEHPGMGSEEEVGPAGAFIPAGCQSRPPRERGIRATPMVSSPRAGVIRWGGPGTAVIVPCGSTPPPLRQRRAACRVGRGLGTTARGKLDPCARADGPQRTAVVPGADGPPGALAAGTSAAGRFPAFSSGGPHGSAGATPRRTSFRIPRWRGPGNDRMAERLRGRRGGWRRRGRGCRAARGQNRCVRHRGCH